MCDLQPRWRELVNWRQDRGGHGTGKRNETNVHQMTDRTRAQVLPQAVHATIDAYQWRTRC